MLVIARILAGVLVLAHGLVHLLYLAPDVPEFSLNRSWLVGEGARRPVALALIVGTVVSFTILALAIWGTPGLSTSWRAFAVMASLLSAVLLITFWNARLAFGLALDVTLIGIAATRPHWAQQFFTAR